MSSFIGFIGKNEALNTTIKKLVPSPVFAFENQNLFICSAQSSSNIYFNSNTDSNSGWVSCGIGISSGDSPTIYKQQDWEHAFATNIDLHDDLNGHFAIVKWDHNTIELFTDQLGMRSIFIHQTNDFTLFTTRLDWLLQLVSQTSINWKLFGSNWLSLNPLSSSCFLDGIDRLAQGGYARISKSSVHLENKRWTPKPVQSSVESVKNSIKGFSLSALNTFSKTSLGLSGGLDSRVLFALLASQKRSDFDLYTFEVNDHPDVEFARRLNAFYNFEHNVIPIKSESSNQLLSELGEKTTRSMLASSIFNVDALKGYEQLGPLDANTIDGAFGEIGRRRFLRGLELKAHQVVTDKSISGLLPYLSANKGDIFNSDVIHEMKSGLFEELETEVNFMPDANKIGVGNWIDLFVIRSRVQNLPGLNQGFSDSTVIHIMPFLQPDLLNRFLSLPEVERSNAQIFRKIIREQAPSLTKIPLVKGNDIYPFWLKDLSSIVWVKAKRKLGLGYRNTQPIELISSLEEYIRDTFNSSSVVQQSFYDKSKIESIINRFFDNKESHLATQLGWLVSFESFRKLIP
ncbi:MAG: asparagine synthase-related protein [Balneolaceae bacterium]